MEPIITIDEFKRIMLMELMNTPHKPIRLSKNEKKAMRIIAANPCVTHIELAKRLGITEKGAWRMFFILERRCRIRRVGSDNEYRWEVLK